MFKEIFIRIYQLIMRPSAAWQKMDEQGEVAQSLFFSRFLFPIMGIAALSCFGRRVQRPNLRTCSEIGNCRICQILYRVLLSCFFIERNPTVLFGSERKGAYRAVRRFSARFIHDGRYCRKYTAERLFFFGICRIGNILCHLDRSQNIFAHR